MSIDTLVNVTTAATSVCAIAISVYAVRVQRKQARTMLSASTLREYESEYYSSPALLRARSVTAAFLLNRKDAAEPPVEAFRLLDFFDKVGLHVEKEAIDVEMAWVVFHYWFDKYWFLLQPDVEKMYERHTDGVRYLDNCASLYVRLNEFGRLQKKLPEITVRCRPARIAEFLTEEMAACGGG
jgi:hypothetical protein